MQFVLLLWRLGFVDVTGCSVVKNHREASGMLGKPEDIGTCGTHTWGEKQGFGKHTYREFKHLGFAGREGEMPPFLE